MDYKRNLSYFSPTSIAGPVLFLIIGIVLVIISICLFSARLPAVAIILLVIGIALAVISGVFIFMISQNNMTDGEIDEEIRKEVVNTLGKLPDKLGIDLEQVNVIEPILIKQNYLKRIRGECKLRVGNDGKLRSSNYEVVAILFTEAEIYCYKRQFSLIRPEQYIETNEYHYVDIISLSTESLNTENRDDPFIQENVDGEMFTISTSGGSSFTASKVITDISDPEKVEELKVFEESVQGMKQLWREKKIFS